MEYTFTLTYRLPAEYDEESLLGRLAASDCDDALVGVGVAGRVALEFTREGASASTALTSAIRDVRRALPSAVLVEVAPDLVGLSDIAELAGVSRQNMRQLMLTHAADFPAPVHSASAALWHLDDLLAWFDAAGRYDVPREVREVAHVARRINVVREARGVGYVAPSLPGHERLRRVLEQEIWPSIPARRRGKPLTRDEEDAILGYGPDGV